MSLRAKFYLTGIVIPLFSLVLCFISPVFLILIVISASIHGQLKCPKCHRRIGEFYTLLSDYKKTKRLNFHMKFTLYDKCPDCGCVWE